MLWYLVCAPGNRLLGGSHPGERSWGGLTYDVIGATVVPLNERRRGGFTELPPPMTCAPPFEALGEALGAWEDALGNSVELMRRGA
jgi:hypothetical protein